MTIVISYPSNDVIIMLSDSAITNDHPQDDGTVDHTYSMASKTLCYPGIGCITKWGDNIFNDLRTHLLQQYDVPVSKPSISELASKVKQYLDGYAIDKPHDELGFHVA